MKSFQLQSVVRRGRGFYGSSSNKQTRCCTDRGFDLEGIGSNGLRSSALATLRY